MRRSGGCSRQSGRDAAPVSDVDAVAIGEPGPGGAVYSSDAESVTVDNLRGGFFEGWATPWTPERHLRHLRAAEAVELALDPATGDAIGFVTAIGDRGDMASVPLLEVLPAWRERGIGHELMRRLLARLSDRYAVDLACDEELVPFYEALGGTPARAMLWRNHGERAVNVP